MSSRSVQCPLHPLFDSGDRCRRTFGERVLPSSEAIALHLIPKGDRNTLTDTSDRNSSNPRRSQSNHRTGDRLIVFRDDWTDSRANLTEIESG
ncbi:MAG: hypothetical protein QNJ41_10755 [Xenococcaceae cyanobacterium MO_188.B32]|nr:hypothetical protein [Xenococcaceae cyanobacterium MO_188.B32]